MPAWQQVARVEATNRGRVRDAARFDLLDRCGVLNRARTAYSHAVAGAPPAHGTAESGKGRGTAKRRCSMRAIDFVTLRHADDDSVVTNLAEAALRSVPQ
jgi:hypothetical protein